MLIHWWQTNTEVYYEIIYKLVYTNLHIVWCVDLKINGKFKGGNGFLLGFSNSINSKVKIIYYIIHMCIHNKKTHAYRFAPKFQFRRKHRLYI